MSAKPPSKLSQYTDPTGELSNKDLAFSGWFVRNKIFLRKITIGVLIGWIVIGGLYSIVMLGSYLFSGFWVDRENRLETVQGFENYTQIQQNYAAEKLLIDSVKIFQTGEMYDFVAMAQNPNPDFVARLRYKYVFEGGETPSKVVTVLPEKKFPLTLYGFESQIYPAGARLVIEDTRWRRIDPHVISNVESYIGSRLNFLVENIFIEKNGIGGPVPSRITFDIKNDTAYSYYEARFALVLLSGNSIEGVIPVSIKDFRSAQTFPVDIRPVFDIVGIDDIELIPVMDIFDQTEFLPVSSD